jgi:hypothetical protein
VAIPLASELHPAALIDGDQMLSVELRGAEDAAVEGGMVVAGGGRKSKRAEYRCAACGYGIVVYGQAPSCPMCREARWEHVEWRPNSQLVDDVAVAVGTRSDVASTRLPRQRRSRSATFARVKPEPRPKNDA